jgi:lauroyl/myristoyl acyltransferase
MLLVLKPAADWLPRSWALSLATGLGKLHARMPYYGRSTRKVVRRSLTQDPKRAQQLCDAILSRHFLDFVILRRYLRGREDLEKWPLIEVNSEIVESLRRSDASYLLATGHFARQPLLPTYLRKITPHQIVQIANPPLPRSWRSQYIWVRPHFDQMLRFPTKLRPETLHLHPGTSNVSQAIARELEKPGRVVCVSPDAPWPATKPGAIVRPFAGRASAGFATGTARLARLAQCPIAVFVSYMNDQKEVVVEWVRVIQPPEREDSQADVAITHLMLDDIERYVGLHPEQYVLEVFGDRRWNPELQRWE